jgi:hypothetical protein
MRLTASILDGGIIPSAASFSLLFFHSSRASRRTSFWRPTGIAGRGETFFTLPLITLPTCFLTLSLLVPLTHKNLPPWGLFWLESRTASQKPCNKRCNESQGRDSLFLSSKRKRHSEWKMLQVEDADHYQEGLYRMNDTLPSGSLRSNHLIAR